MFGMCKHFIRWGIVATVVGGTAVVLAGPDRTKALLGQVQSDVQSIIDENIDDPAALRTQLRELEKEYPARIAALRADHAEVNEQIRQLEREKAIAERVVDLADRDLEELRPLLAELMDTGSSSNGSTSRAELASIRFDDELLSRGQAASKVNQIKQTRIAYSSKVADCAHDLIYLKQQEQKLEELVLQLETERIQFQSQLWQLERQVDAIARNERLIEMLEQREKTIEECSKFEVHGLDQLTARLGELRARQDAELELLTSDQRRVDYEELARMQLDHEGRVEDVLEEGAGGDPRLQRIR